MPLATSAYRLFQADNNAFTLDRVSRSESKPGLYQVLIRIGAVSLNYRDLLVLQGMSGTTQNGLIPLSDAAGTVIAVGAEVTRWRVGDRVSPTFFADWQTGSFRAAYLASALGGGAVDGVLSEYLVLSETALVEVPAHLTLAEAATLPCAAVTAWQALFVRGHLRADETVLIQGTGGVALFALQLAVAQGARAIVISSSDEKLERAAALGAWRTLNYRQQPEWDQAVLEFTEGVGANHVLELGGPDTFARSIAAVAPGGSIAQIGVLTGFGPTPDLLPLQFKNASIHGICVGSGEHFTELNQFLQLHDIRPIIDRRFAFNEAAAAYEYLRGAGHMGKVVIEVDAEGHA